MDQNTKFLCVTTHSCNKNDFLLASTVGSTTSVASTSSRQAVPVGGDFKSSQSRAAVGGQAGEEHTVYL